MPKREELSLRVVLALPKASSTGLVFSSLFFTALTFSVLPETAATYCMIFFDDSVLPAPDSPEIMTTCAQISRRCWAKRRRVNEGGEQKNCERGCDGGGPSAARPEARSETDLIAAAILHVVKDVVGKSKNVGFELWVERATTSVAVMRVGDWGGA